MPKTTAVAEAVHGTVTMIDTRNSLADDVARADTMPDTAGKRQRKTACPTYGIALGVGLSRNNAGRACRLPPVAGYPALQGAIFRAAEVNVVRAMNAQIGPTTQSCSNARSGVCRRCSGSFS